MKKTKSLKKWMTILPLALMSITMAGLPVFDSPVHAAVAPSFSDVPAGHWAYDAVAKLAKAGIVDGYTDKTFKGDKAMSRYEVAFVVAKAMDKYEKADEDYKQLIDKLSSEFAAELNRLGARIAKVEAKTNTWVSGETRFRVFGNDTDATGNAKLKGSNKFDFRQRIKFNGTINEDISWMARAQASSKFGDYSSLGKAPSNTTSTDGTNAAFDMFAITAKNVLGIDKVRIGRFPYDNFTHGLFGKAVGVDGIRIDENFGDILFTASVNNLKNAGNNGDANTLTTAQLSGKINDKIGWRGGYYWSDVPGTNANIGPASTMNTNIGSFKQSTGWAAGFDVNLGKVKLIADYVSTDLKGAENLPTSPKGWAVELTSAVKAPPIFYSAKNLVDYKKKGDFGWSIAYRSVDAGAIPNGAGGFDAQAIANPTDKYNTFTKGTDNIKGLFIAFQSTVAKNVIWTIEGQDLKIKNRGLATDLTSDDIGRTYMTKLEFFY